MSTQNPTSMNRRTFMKTTGLVAGTALLGPQTAIGMPDTSDLPTYDSLDNTGKTLLLAGIPAAASGPGGALAYGTGVIASLALTNNEAINDAADISAHQQCTSAAFKWEHTYNILRNWMNDNNHIANIEARNAIANSWESDETVSEAQTNAHSAIEDYLIFPYRNALTAMLVTMYDFAGVRKMTKEAGIDDWHIWGVVDDDITNGDVDPARTHIVDEVGEDLTANFVMPNGESHEMETVKFKVTTDNGEVWEEKFDQDFIDNYDSGNWTFDIDGNTSFTDDFKFNSRSVATEDETLPNTELADLTNLMEILNKIQDRISTIKSNYTETFIQELYDAMDSGQLNPNDVRGVEGIVRHLSGSNDAQEGRYQIALSSLTDGVVPDPETTSRIDMTLNGWKNQTPMGDNYELQGYFDNEQKSGMIFAQSPESDIQDGTFMVNTPTCVSNSSDIMMLNGKGKTLYKLGSLDYGEDPLVNFSPNMKTFITSTSNTTDIRKMSDGTIEKSLNIGFGSFVTNNVIIGEKDGIVLADTAGNIIARENGYSLDGTKVEPVSPNNVYASATNNGNNTNVIVELDVNLEDSPSLDCKELITESHNAGGGNFSVDFANNDLAVWDGRNAALINLKNNEIVSSGELPLHGDSSNKFLIGDLNNKRLAVEEVSDDSNEEILVSDVSGDNYNKIFSKHIQNIEGYTGIEFGPSGAYLSVCGTDNLGSEPSEFDTITINGTNPNNHNMQEFGFLGGVTIANAKRETKELRNTDVITIEEDTTKSYNMVGKLTIGKIVDSDGNEVNDPVNWHERKYRTTDVGEYSNYVAEVSESQGEAYEEAKSPDIPGVGGVSDFLDDLINALTNPNSWLPSWVIYAIIGVVALVAGLFGINVLGTVTGGD